MLRLTLTVALLAPLSFAATLSPRDGYKIPSTSFDSQSTFDTYWAYNYPWGTDHNGAARMASSQVSVGGGQVTLTAAPTSGQAPTSDGLAIHYLSGTIYAKEYFTVAANGGYDFSGDFLASTAKGTWPAFWLTGANSWPPEIDLAEWKGSGKISFNSLGINNQWITKDVAYGSGGWHTLKMEVRDLNGVDVKTKFYMDGALQATQTGNAMVGKPFWLIMDYQMEGSSGSPGPTSSMDVPKSCRPTADNSQAPRLSLRGLLLTVTTISLMHNACNSSSKIRTNDMTRPYFVQAEALANVTLFSHVLRQSLLYDPRSTYYELGYSEIDCKDLSLDDEMPAISAALEHLGHHVTLVPGIKPLVQQLAIGKATEWDLVFNVSEGFFGTARESQVPGLLEAYQIPYTFSDAATLALCLDKGRTKIILEHHNIPTASYLIISKDEEPVDYSKFTSLSTYYPLFVKPVAEGSQKGIEEYNKVNIQAELVPAIKKVRARFPGQDIMVEKFLAGREMTVSILGTGSQSRVIGVREFFWPTSSSGTSATLDFPTETSDFDYNDSPDMTDPQVEAACQVALETWKILGCRDAGRVDMRFGVDREDSVPNVLEINPIAGLTPGGHSALPACAVVNGIPFEDLMAQIVDSAMKRTHNHRLL
ncbi:hypothetical protein V500_04030 [Pseudogymnoascus sp. VKM F-4518 (FW-2643)]|nr:hypothetical protein V500_04030 [Pseudogymnoascus sp. VKM F-4518 (FW-2643)]